MGRSRSEMTDCPQGDPWGAKVGEYLATEERKILEQLGIVEEVPEND